MEVLHLGQVLCWLTRGCILTGSYDAFFEDACGVCFIGKLGIVVMGFGENEEEKEEEEERWWRGKGCVLYMTI
jgi:hypothetical protein